MEGNFELYLTLVIDFRLKVLGLVLRGLLSFDFCVGGGSKFVLS